MIHPDNWVGHGWSPDGGPPEGLVFHVPAREPCGRFAVWFCAFDPGLSMFACCIDQLEVRFDPVVFSTEPPERGGVVHTSLPRPRYVINNMACGRTEEEQQSAWRLGHVCRKAT